MNKIVTLCALLFTTAAFAEPALTECVADDGSSFFMMAENGAVGVKWSPDGPWGRAFGKRDGDNIVVTQIAKHGVIVIGWNYKSSAAYVVMKDDRSGKQSEFNARCWFK